MPKPFRSNPKPDLSWPELIQLLTEAREAITDKPWDDSTRLHERISKALGLPVSYPNWGRDEEDDDAQAAR